jgi:hypothetical protein
MKGFFLFGQVNDAATAFAYLLQEFVAADAVARFLWCCEARSFVAIWLDESRLFEDAVAV